MYNDQQGGGGYSGGPRQMFSGNWTCGSCGNAINSLPFNPDPAKLASLKCQDCHKKSVAERGGGFRGGGGNFSAPTRQMVSGNWSCGSCGNPINELPFQPDPARLGTLKCRDCHKKSMGDRGGYNRF